MKKKIMKKIVLIISVWMILALVLNVLGIAANVYTERYISELSTEQMKQEGSPEYQTVSKMTRELGAAVPIVCGACGACAAYATYYIVCGGEKKHRNKNRNKKESEK